ncbi:MAG: Gfo/Idh/MocA family oxidoreductase [Verrucomicrobiae bacterium]|nr:Gfo/Idh/MocA family oxidoreductase [Verrucomicrobiae bacterium]
MNRRQFIRSSAATAAVFTILKPALVRGSTANSKIRLGLIGCGGRGRWIAELFAAHGGYRLVGAADYFQERVDAVAAKHQLKPEQTVTGLKCAEKMLAKGGLDAVAIESPPYFHPEQAAAAVAAGLHVYIAKPLAVDVPGCLSIQRTARAATQNGLVFLVDFQSRADQYFIEAMRRVHAGALGTLVFGEALYHTGRLSKKSDDDKTAEGRLRNWVFDKALSGDIIVEQNIHTLDIMNWAMNQVPPLRCTGLGGRKGRTDVGDCWDYFTCLYEYPNKVGITFSSRQYNLDAPGGIICKIYGTKGALLTEYGGEVIIRGGEGTFYRGGKTTGIYKDGTVANIKTFHDSVMAKNSTNPTAEPSVMSNLIAIMGRMAAYGGRTVTWNEVLRNKERLDARLTGLKA